MTSQQQPVWSLFGTASLIAGAASLLIALFYFWAAPLEPQPSLERTIAETAVNISKEVVRVIRKEPAVLEQKAWTLDRTVPLAAVICGALALILAAVGYVRREDHRPVVAGAALGAGAVGFQFLSWIALMGAGLVLIWIIVANLGEILGSA